MPRTRLTLPRLIAGAALSALALALTGCGTVSERIGPPPPVTSGPGWSGVTEERQFREVIRNVQRQIREYQDQRNCLPDSLTELALLGNDIPDLKRGYRYWYDPETGHVGVERK